MNHISQRNQLEILQRKYVKFMSICPDKDVVKLAKEIIKIENRITIIREMSLNKLMQSLVVDFETKQSKLNFKTI